MCRSRKRPDDVVLFEPWRSGNAEQILGGVARIRNNLIWGGPAWMGGLRLILESGFADHYDPMRGALWWQSDHVDRCDGARYSSFRTKLDETLWDQFNYGSRG